MFELLLSFVLLLFAPVTIYCVMAVLKVGDTVEGEGETERGGRVVGGGFRSLLINIRNSVDSFFRHRVPSRPYHLIVDAHRPDLTTVLRVQTALLKDRVSSSSTHVN